MPEIQLLRPDHIPPLLAFELENRDYFTRWVPNRGDDYFAHFDERLGALLAEQEAGICYFHVVLNDKGEIVGRVNLVDAADGEAELGYRIAERATGAGLAQWAVRELCGIAANSYRLTGLRAGITVANKASQAVLERSGFEVVGEAAFRGKPGLTYHRSLAEFLVHPSAPTAS
ncbi:GNAT family N-acetyltransferase [Streptomyces cocklensis]|uniref:Ribosomal-protein-alanine N-acetyltransferase n=1 Tax=Actinacidiphila cocklensis TaxID=887465 RepID=A0A9W4GRV7_9ACTN|nr:GNAT family N-acetyltransferase [Actinacidiphila cocklensis]MDD1063007.1 GNAT family N-acetyltransferase [Actinacidiphila cocklensis]CAG6394789.1 Ribosomal-protein-alanine N-acetyltransferase [Actinacidiphila cocklensis]